MKKDQQIMASNKMTDYQPPEPPGLFQRILEANPLALGLVALAIGALIGLLLPETRKENELMGAKRDELLNQGRQVVGDLTHRAEVVAGTAKGAATEALEKARGAAQEALGEATTAAREAVSEAVASVKDEVKHQGEGLVPKA